LILASVLLIKPVLSASESLVPSLAPISRTKPIIEFLPLGSNAKTMKSQSALNSTFYPNGTMIFQFINVSREKLIIDPVRLPQAVNLTLVQNSTHIAYYLNRTGIVSAYLYFDFSRNGKIKLSIVGSIITNVALNIPMRFLNGTKAWKGSTVWCSTTFPEDDTVITGIGFDWSDVKGGTFSNTTNTLALSLSGSFSLDPSIVATTTSSTATLNPSENKAFFCPVNSFYYVFYLSAEGSIKYSYSSDGSTWTQSAIFANAQFGYGLDVAWNGSQYHFIVAWSETTQYYLGTPQAGGTIVISYMGRVLNNYFTYSSSGLEYDQYPSTALKSGNIYNFSVSASIVSTYSTNITRGSALGGQVFIFSPFANVTTSTGNTTFASCGFQAKGWESPISEYLTEAYIVANVRIRNPTTVKINGTVAVRLYKDSTSAFSSPKALADVGGNWLTSIMNFSGASGEAKDVVLYFDCHNLTDGQGINILNNDWFYAQFAFQFDGVPSGETVQLEDGGTNTNFDPGTKNFTYVHIGIDSDNYPWFGICFNRGDSNTGHNAYIPLLVKGNTNYGSIDPRYVTTYKPKENPQIASSWRAKPVPLTSSKLVLLYWKGSSACYSRCFNGTWNSEETIPCSDQNTTGSGRDYVSALAINDTVHFAYMNTSQMLNHLNWTSSTSWLYADNIASANVSGYVAPFLIYDSANNKLRCFWGGASSPNFTMYYKLWDGHIAWTHEASSQPWFLDMPGLGGYTITGSSYAYGSRCTLAYMTGTSSPYTVNFCFLNFGVVKAWVTVATWTFTLGTRAWISIATWTLSLLTRAWIAIASWILNLQTRTWTTILSWLFDPITRSWIQALSWILTLQTIGWQTIATWILSLQTSTWTTITIWLFTLGREDMSFLIIPILFLFLVCGAVLVLAYKRKQSI
jgi:hypothetical protein